MSGDKLVYDLSQEVDSSPNVFINKAWINVLDNQNGQYNSNQSVIDTSQLSNSSKWCSYRESYLQLPLLLTLASANATASIAAIDLAPNTAGTSCDYAVGLKSWFGNMIHSMSVDMNGVTVIQQTQYIQMWNSFKLLTSLSYGDMLTTSSTIGFYPDDPLAWTFNASAAQAGQGVCNNSNIVTASQGVVSVTNVFNRYNSGGGNIGFQKRQMYINYDADAASGDSTFSNQFTTTQCQNLWKSYVSRKVNAVAATSQGVYQVSIMATIYLKHLHSFFQSIPLLKGVFMKITLALNNCSTTISKTATTGVLTLVSVSNGVGGVNPVMIASGSSGNGASLALGGSTSPATGANYICNVSVGATCLDSTLSSNATVYPIASGTLGKSVTLYVPTYVFNPIFESAYISSPIKPVAYTDVYQYQVTNISANGGSFNNLISNGISSLKSVLIVPFYSVSGSATGLPSGIPVYQSPFDPAGCGPTSPLVLLTNFNIVVSGQNMIYNTVVRSTDMFNNQLLGCNAINSAQTDGLTSGLFNSLGFEMEYCYYYVDVSRMLPVEESVPKSVQIIGTNASNKAIDLFVFCEYQVGGMSIDCVSGSRV